MFASLEKNVRLIVEALFLMKDVPFRMFFIGTGYAERELQKLVVQSGLNSVVAEEVLNRYACIIKNYASSQ